MILMFQRANIYKKYESEANRKMDERQQLKRTEIWLFPAYITFGHIIFRSRKLKNGGVTTDRYEKINGNI